ncbi:unnamed protein product, partial [Oppiella nova]
SDDFLLNAPGVLDANGVYTDDNGIITNCTAMNSQSVGSTLSFVLSACGYDVWLGNNRGNRYSDRHILLNPNTEYSQIIRPFIALAPVAYVGAIESIILRLGALLEPLLSSTNIPFFGVSSNKLRTIDRYFGHFFCGNTFFDQFCEIFVFLLCGFDFPNTNVTRIPAIIGHFPDGTSSLILAHLAQRVNNKNFAYYDYGNAKNARLYGQSNPPSYNLAQITSRNIALMTGVNDYLADPTDVDILRSQLTVPIYDDYVIPYTLWNHADYLIGINAGKFMNSRILKILSDFN